MKTLWDIERWCRKSGGKLEVYIKGKTWHADTKINNIAVGGTSANSLSMALEDLLVELNKLSRNGKGKPPVYSRCPICARLPFLAVWEEPDQANMTCYNSHTWTTKLFVHQPLVHEIGGASGHKHYAYDGRVWYSVLP